VNEILVGDTLYAVTKAYVDGARAMRASVPHHANPYRGDRADEWSQGHDNEAAGEHFRFGRDVLADPSDGREIGEDPALSRNEYGEVCEKQGTEDGPYP
jgi:hypothetical protein